MDHSVEEVLNELTAEELLEARRLIDRLLEELRQQGGLARPAPEGMSEARQFERYSVNLQVTYFRHAAAQEKGGAAAVQDALVRDIARGGIRFFTAEILEPTEVLTFYLPRPLGIRKLFVEVRWVERRGGQFECGARFVGLDRVFAAQRTEERRSEAVQIILASEPSAELESLEKLIVQHGYSAYRANSVPEALAALDAHPRSILLGSAPLLLAEDARLIQAVEEGGGSILSVVVATPSELDDPQIAPRRRCHDYIVEPDHAHEVRVVVARVYRRLAAAEGAQAPT